MLFYVTNKSQNSRNKIADIVWRMTKFYIRQNKIIRHFFDLNSKIYFSWAGRL